MNRFRKGKLNILSRISFWLPVAFFTVLLVFFLQGVKTSGETALARQEESLRNALQRSITQCYALEGAYPPSVEYLSEHYGLTYDSEAFLVDYVYYGSNLLPDSFVLRKTAQEVSE